MVRQAGWDGIRLDCKGKLAESITAVHTSPSKARIQMRGSCLVSTKKGLSLLVIQICT